jgi:hypothetical protein
VPHHEDWDIARELRSYNFNHVGKHKGGRTRISLFGGLLHTPTKTPLVKADDKNTSLGETGE